MKHLSRIAAVAAMMAVVVIATSCGPVEDTDKSFDSSLLAGKWENDAKTKDYYRYKNDGTGTEWDENENVHEGEDGSFSLKWTLDGSKLVKSYYQKANGTYGVPKYYTVVGLTANTLVYTDDVSRERRSFHKVE